VNKEANAALNDSGASLLDAASTEVKLSAVTSTPPSCSKADARERTMLALSFPSIAVKGVEGSSATSSVATTGSSSAIFTTLGREKKKTKIS
jgi:hypothetical protein